MQIYHYLYLGGITLVSFFSLFWIRFLINRLESKRTQTIEKMKNHQSIPRETPNMSVNSVAKYRSIENIQTQFSMLRRIITPAILLLWIVMICYPFLSMMPATLVGVMVAIITAVTGIAARPMVENLIAGIMISFSQPIRIGDTVVIDEHYGIIEDITMSHTKLRTWDYKRYVISNKKLLEKEIMNYSIVDKLQWAYIEFYVAYDSDIDKVEELAKKAAKQSCYYCDHEEPSFWVMGTNKDSIACWVAAWSDSPSNAWMLTHDMRKALVRLLQKNKIKSHFSVHFYQPTAEFLK